MFDVLNQSTLATFAEPFTYKGKGLANVLLQGVFDSSLDQEDVGGAGFGDRVYALMLLESVVVANGIAPRDTVNVRGVDYQIIDQHVDASGMATLILRRY